VTRAKLEKRLQILEAKLVGGVVVLTFADGSKREIPGHGQYLLKLIANLSQQEKLSATEREHIEAVCESVGAKEPGGGRMTELIHCFMAGPVETCKPVTAADPPTGGPERAVDQE
jgi:hypothetical protein